MYSTEALFQPLISEGLFLFVDANFGNDTNGRPNNRSKPFKSISAAVNMSKQLIGTYTLIINPGRYSESSNLLWNCNYFFQPGSVVTNISTNPLFSDSTSTSGYVASITGYGTFISRSQIVNNNGSITKQVYGPIFSLSNARTRITWMNQDINTLDVEAFIITNCEEFKVSTFNSINLDGDSFGFRINGKNVQISATTISGRCVGFEWKVYSGGINCKEFRLPRANGLIDDYTTISTADVSGCNLLRADIFEVLSLVSQCTKGDNRSYFSDATITNSVTLTNIYSANYEPSMLMTFDRLKSNLMTIRGRKGSLTVQVNLEFFGIGTTPSLIVEGCNQNEMNAMINLQMTKVNCTNVYLGRNATDLTHQSGSIIANFNQLICTSFYAGFLYYTGAKQYQPRISLEGLQWKGKGFLSSKTGGVIDFSVSQVRETVVDGGVITIQDFDTTVNQNEGTINIHDSLIKNENTTQTTTSEILTAIYIPDANTQAIISVISTTLSIGLPQSDPSLSDPFVRTLEPIYPIENCISPPLCSVNSYKQIMARNSSNPSPDPTYWSGTNLIDTRYVLL